MYKNETEFYKFPRDLELIERKLGQHRFTPLYLGDKRQYLNYPISFDIETTSTITGEKNATMYIWQMSVDGVSFYGREWEEWEKALEWLVDYAGATKSYQYIPIYVHNLAYEFAFIRKFFGWEEVFAIRNRRPIYARTSHLEFRCSYFLSNASLALVGKQMVTRYPINKLEGDLDYSLPRHSKTPLTEKELGYCQNDVLVVTSYIQQLIESEGGITNIPYTSTGFVRNDVRRKCYPEDDDKATCEYKALMKGLTLSSAEYEQLKRAFMGGYTHASCLHSGHTMTNVNSYDRTSAYPFEMLTKKYPMSKFKLIGTVTSISVFKSLLENYSCVFDVEFTSLEVKPMIYEHVLSASKCTFDSAMINNGRIVKASRLVTTLTDVDWTSVSRCYSWSEVKVTNLRCARRGYLPKSIILAVLEYYGYKTSLKGVEGKEELYMKSKNKLNAIFGMMVTDIIQNQFTITESGDWSQVQMQSHMGLLKQYNSSHKRFLYYPWGVWITAYARQTLFDAIFTLGSNYIYADTDSVKGRNMELHQQYFNLQNAQCKLQLEEMCKHYDIDIALCHPKNPKGEEKWLGVWEHDGCYSRFKTLGAKRYMYIDSATNSLNLTVAGVNKKFAIPWLLSEYGSYLSFYMFDEGLYLPPEATGKNLLTYIDEERTFTLVDYNGQSLEIKTPSSVHMEPEGYLFSINAEYLRFLNGLEFVDH